MIVEIRNHQGYVIEDRLYSVGTRSEAVKWFNSLRNMTAHDWDIRAEVTDYAFNHIGSIVLSHEGETIAEYYPEFTPTRI